MALRHRGIVKFFLNIAIFLFANYLAFYIRFDFDIPNMYLVVLRETLPVLLVAKLAGFLAFGQFRGWWRYVSIKDILPITAGCFLGSALYGGAVSALWGAYHVPRSIYLMDFGITLLLVLAGRYAIRIGRETFGRRRLESDRQVLIVGAGAAGQMIAREIRENPSLGMIEVGFIDDDKAKIGTRIEGLKVLGGHGKIEEICRKYEVEEIIIAIPSAAPAVVRTIVEHCRKLPARFRILPGVGELIDGKVSVKALRNVDLEDLLGREQVALDTELLRRDITGRTVMVTGAAGSIGSELCRQVARLSPVRLVMFEMAESALFSLEHEMCAAFPNIHLVPVIGDVRDRQRVREVLSEHLPAVIYHAAAYKHVPVMEAHPVEAVKNNVLGTRVVAEAAAEFGVERFVLVSTDKAVRPTNVMGATKRVAELVVLNMNGAGKDTAFVAVRFGNVLDSVGSVVPIFRRQLETTGKLTVTHPDASRYFMLIPEAVGLILQAGAMGQGREVFVLDMGEPIKVVDLAKNLIRLSGKELGVDAEIVYTGLRPGEKLREELVIEGEDVIRTSHPKVMKMIGDVDAAAAKDWGCELDRLIELAAKGDRLGVVRQLSLLVKGYTPHYRFHGIDFPAEGISAPPILPFPPSESIH
jgi:FlaA1/EpsC-like NDP-sugar epimerase